MDRDKDGLGTWAQPPLQHFHKSNPEYDAQKSKPKPKPRGQ